MHTLQEFMIYAKIADYVIAVVFFLAFIGFWRLLNTKGHAPEDNDEEAKTLELVEDQEVDKAA